MKKRLLGVLGVAICLSAAMPVWAAGDAAAKEAAKADKAEQFKARKAREVQDLEAKLSCIKAANTPAEMKRCQEAQKARHQNEQLQRIQDQRKKLDEREKNLQEKKTP
ncbi:MAG: hypothetical protein H7834_02670 [Magnetococcus sp. YQC-9]